MDSLKIWHWGVLAAAAAAVVLYLTYSHLRYFGSVSFLGAILFLEITIACLWKYKERFFILLIVAFAWAGMSVPLENAWTAGRWAVLGVGAVGGFMVWMRDTSTHFRLLHLLAVACVGTAFVSASVSPFVQMASYKALSLLLLFLYCSCGARASVLGREERFISGLVWGCELLVYGTSVCYMLLGQAIWGNPNSLGAVMSVAVFPILLWAWMNAEGPVRKARRLLALLLCVYLTFFSMARAGIAAVVVTMLVYCLCLRQYKLLVRVVAIILCGIAITGMLAPAALSSSLRGFADDILYKGHKEKGVLGSRRTPWEKSLSTIKEHPLFGTGYGTSPTGEDPGLNFGRFASSAETARENGSSYVNIVEWVGLLGVIPFVALLTVSVINVGRVCRTMLQTRDPRNYTIPFAMVVLSGLIHANFEDWLFAVGYYLCVYFWFVSFVLAEFVPARSPDLVAEVRVQPGGLKFGSPVPIR
jgi:O-antigen ligase